MRNVIYLLIMMLFFTCDTREIAIEPGMPDFTVQFYTTNLTVPVHSLNLITLEIDGNSHSTYTLRYGTSGNINLYDKEMRMVGQTVGVERSDTLYLRPNIVGDFNVSFHVENELGGSDGVEIALSVTE